MFEGFAEELEQDLRDLRAMLRAKPPTDETIEIDRRVRATGNIATAARRVLQLAEQARPVRPQEEDEDGMGRQFRSDPGTLERKHRSIDANLARIRQQLDARGKAGAADPAPDRGAGEELADEAERRAA
jgi:hypothetical protein